MKLRQIVEADFSVVVEKYLDVFAKEPWNETHEKEKIEEYVQNLYAMNSFVGFIAEEEASQAFIGVALGFIKPWYAGKEYLLDTFFVDVQQQQAGLGSRFLTLLKKELHDRAISGIILDTDRGMPAEKFYLKNGFEAAATAVLMFSETKA